MHRGDLEFRDHRAIHKIRCETCRRGRKRKRQTHTIPPRGPSDGIGHFSRRAIRGSRDVSKLWGVGKLQFLAGAYRSRRTARANSRTESPHLFIRAGVYRGTCWSAGSVPNLVLLHKSLRRNRCIISRCVANSGGPRHQ